MRAQAHDTPLDAERVLVKGWRRMGAAQKLRAVFGMNAMLRSLQAARLRASHPGLGEEELRLRLGALWLGRDAMVAAFGWDPETRGR